MQSPSEELAQKTTEDNVDLRIELFPGSGKHGEDVIQLTEIIYPVTSVRRKPIYDVFWKGTREAYEEHINLGVRVLDALDKISAEALPIEESRYMPNRGNNHDKKQ